MNHEYTDDPTESRLRSLREGWFVEVWPRQSKCDCTGEVWGDKKIILHWGNEIDNPAAALAALELALPVHGEARRAIALFVDDAGSPVTPARADRTLRSLLLAVVAPATAATFSWHSFRISFATRLQRAGCPAPIIQLLGRWQSPESLKIYGRLEGVDFRHWLSRTRGEHLDGGAPLTVCVDHAADALGALGLRSAPQATPTTQPPFAPPRIVPPPAAAPATAPTAATPASLLVTPPAGFDISTLIPVTTITSAALVGRRVLVPASLWPTYRCREYNGRGWEATVSRATRTSATVRFVRATARNGMPYAATRVPLAPLLLL